MISIKNLNKYYDTTHVLNNINIEINKGEIFAIVGHSGAGKSTLLRCINGLESYANGSLKVKNKEVSNLKKDELRNFRKNVGMIFQHFSLLSRKTVFENIALPMQLWGYKKEEIDKKIESLLALVGISEKSSSYPSSLSGGQKQRVAIARALSLDPEILLSDEATSALDYESEKIIQDNMESIKHNRTMLIIAHRLSTVRDCDVIYALDKGEIIEFGSHDELMEQEGYYHSLITQQDR